MADGLQGEAIEPLILKKKIKIPAEAHGGAWKVAYADFVTAMMAFFLLLWLLNATTEDQMTGLSDYFAPPSASEDSQGIGQALAGATAALEGAMRSASSPPVTSIAIPSYGAEEEGEETGEEREDPDLTDVNQGDATPEQHENQMLDDAMAKLQQSLKDDPALRELQDSILFEVTEDGLLIQLLDYQQREMFEPGTAAMTRRAVQLLALISGIIVQMPHTVAITGHTDSAPQPGATAIYGNWELSGDRAAASRDWMETHGFPPERLIRVEGKADTDLLDPREPENERNRRVSILLLRQNPIERPRASVTETPSNSGDEDGGGSQGFVAGPAPARDATGLAPPPLPDN